MRADNHNSLKRPHYTATEAGMSQIGPPLLPFGMDGQACLAPSSAPMKKGCIRPFRLTTLVRTRFEEAAFRYAAEVRRAACFPPTTTTPATTRVFAMDTTPVIATLATPRITTRRGLWEVPTQPVRPTVHIPDPAPPTPLPDAWISNRSWDEGDTIVRGIQEMRSQFGKKGRMLYSRPPQPLPLRASRLPPQLPVSPLTQRRTRPVRSLFRGGGGRGSGNVHVQDDEDEWVDIEEVSPPRTTYHLYRLSADGTSCTLPLSVMPSCSTSLHPAHPTFGRNNHSQTRGGSVALPPQSYAFASLTQQHRLPLVNAALLEQDRFTNSHYMGPQMPPRQSRQPEDSGVALRQPASRYYREALRFTVPHRAKADNPEGTVTSFELGEDDDVLLVSDNEVSLIEISSDSSPEVDGGARETRRMNDKKCCSPPGSVTALPKEVNKDNLMLSGTDTRTDKSLSSEDDGLPDVTCTPPTAGHHCGGDSKTEDNLSDASTIAFEDINLDDWTEGELEDVTTNTSSGWGASTSLVAAAAAHGQSGGTVNLAVDNLEVVSLPCMEQNTNSTGKKNQNDELVICDTTSHQLAEETHQDNFFIKTKETMRQQNNQEGNMDKDPTDEEAATKNGTKEAAVPLIMAHDEATDTTKGGHLAVARSESLLTEGKEEDKITSEAEVKCVESEPEVEAAGTMLKEAAQVENAEEEPAPQETNAPTFVVAPSAVSALNVDQLHSAEGKVHEKRDLVVSENQSNIVAEEENGLDKNANNEVTDTTTTYAEEKDTEAITTSKDLEKYPENDKALQEPITFTEDVTEIITTSKDLEKHIENDKALMETVTDSHHPGKARSEAKGRKKKRRRSSQRPKRVHKPREIRGSDINENNRCELIDPSCTLFVSDGQLVVAIQVPWTLGQEGDSDKKKCDGAETSSQHLVTRMPSPPGTPLHLLSTCSPHHIISTQREKNGKVETLFQQSPTLLSAPPSSPVRPPFACPPHSPHPRAASHKEDSITCGPSEDGECESRSGNTEVPETEHTEPAEKGQANMEWENTDRIYGGSAKGNKGPDNDEAMETKKISNKEHEVSHLSELSIDGSMIPNKSTLWELRSVETDDTKNPHRPHITQLCQDETLSEATQDAGEGKEVSVNGDETLCKSSKVTESCRLEVMSTSREPQKEDQCSQEIRNKITKVTTENSNSSVETDIARPILLMPDEEETGANIDRIAVVEMRATPESVPEMEAKVTPELVLEAEERKMALQQVPTAEERKVAPEQVPETEERGVLSKTVSKVKGKKIVVPKLASEVDDRSVTLTPQIEVEEEEDTSKKVPEAEGKKEVIPEQKPYPKETKFRGDTTESPVPEEERRIIPNQEDKTKERKRDVVEFEERRGVIPGRQEAETEENGRDIAEAPKVEKRREIILHQEVGTAERREIAEVLEMRKIRGTEKDVAAGSPRSSSDGSESESGSVRQGKPAILGRPNSNNSSSSSSSNSSGISRLAERLLELRLKGRLPRPLKYNQTQSNATLSVSINTDKQHGAGKPCPPLLASQNSPFVSASPDYQRHKDTLRGLVEELNLMGKRRLAAMYEERQGIVGLPDSPSGEPRGLHHYGRRETNIDENGKEENSGFTFIQCVAEIHHSADAEYIDMFKQQGFKTKRGRLHNYVDSGRCKRKDDNTSNTGSTDEAKRTGERKFTTDKELTEEEGTESRTKGMRGASGKDAIAETKMEVHDEVVSVETIGACEFRGKKMDVLPTESTRKYIQREEYSEGPSSNRESEDSLASTVALEKPDMRSKDGLATHKAEHREQPTKGNWKRDEFEESTLAPPQGDIIVMNNAPPTQPLQPSPLPSASDFVKEVLIRIDPLHTESNHTRLHQEGTLRPRVFGHTLQDFIESTCCGEDPQERRVADSPPISSNMGLGSDSIPHSVDGKITSSSTSPSGARSSLSGIQSSVSGSQAVDSVTQLIVSATQPSDSGALQTINGTQTVIDGTQPYLQEVQSEPLASETQPSHSMTQPPARGSQQSSEGSLPPASQSQPSSVAAGTGGTKERKKRWREEAADEESEVEGMPRERKRRRKGRDILHQVVEVPLTDKLSECLRVVAAAGEALLAPLRNQGVMGPSHRFTSLQSDHTRSLLNQMVRNRRKRLHSGGEDNTNYKNLLALHGLIKAAGLLRHCGLRPALHCLGQFHRTHHVLLAGCYAEVMARLEAILERGGEGAVHPKVTTLRREMQRARQREDPGDTEFKVLVAARREAQWVCRQLEEEFGLGNVALLSRMPEYDHVLRLLERQSIVVWEEGEALHQLPCSQFSLVVEWEGSSSSSVCVDHCTRQNIHVVSFSMPSQSTAEQETTAREGSRDQHEGKDNTCITSRRENKGGTGSSRGRGRKGMLTVVASDSVTANTELHYILTSMFDVNLVERNARNIMLEEGRQGWADLLLDERTCVLLRPLATLRSDAHLNELTCHLVLLSLQCTTCYILLYSQQSANSGYEFRSSMVRALARLVATCVLFCSPEYTVSLLLAHDLNQVGKVVRELCETARTSSPVWDPEEWTTRPWLTPQMSSHERLLLSLPCINSISAQVILTAMSLPQVLESPLPQLRKALPWIPDKVTIMLHKLIHGDPITDIKIGRYSCVSKGAVLANDDENAYRCKTGVCNYQNAGDTQCTADAHYSLDCSYNTAKTYPPDRRGSDVTALCSEEEGRLIPSVPSTHYLPDRVSLITARDVMCEYPSKASNEAAPQNSYFCHNEVVPKFAYSTLPPAAVVTAEEPAQINSSIHTDTILPIAGNNEYRSSQVSDNYFPKISSADLQILKESYVKHPSKDLFNPHKYLHIMEQDNRTNIQSPHLTPWQSQELPQQAPWQCQQLPQQQQPQQYHYSLPSQLLQQPKENCGPKERGVVVISPYFLNFLSPKADTKPPVALPTQPYSHVPPQPSTSSFPDFLSQTIPAPDFLLQTQKKLSRSPMSNHTYSNAFSTAVILGNTHQDHQKALPHQQQLCPEKVFETVKPNQWHDITRVSGPTSQQSQQGQGPPNIFDFQSCKSHQAWS